MPIDRKNILLFIPTISTDYTPSLDYKGLGSTEEEKLYVIMNLDKPDFDFKKHPLRFHWKLNTPFQEKRLRKLDCFSARGGDMSERSFFIHDRLLECWHDLLEKDLRILPTECYTDNGLVTEFHLAYVINVVDGLDPDLTNRISNKNGRYSVYREVPKANNDFMNGSQIARERAWCTSAGDFYITPELVENTLKYLRKKRIRDVYIMTFKEHWEWLHRSRVDYPPYSADYSQTLF